MDYTKKIAHRSWRYVMYDSMYRNALFLMINMGVTAGFGFLFWVVCAHLFTSHEVGRATAFIAACTLAASCASLGLNRTMVRFLAQDTNRRQFVATAMTLTTLASVVSAGIILAILPRMGTIRPTLLMGILFITTAAGLALKNLIESVFVARRAAGNAVAENSMANIIRLAAPFALTGLGFAGIFFAQAIFAIAAVVAGVFLLVRKPFRGLYVCPALGAMRGKWKFSLGSYSADLIGGLPLMVLPILVTHTLGVQAGAYWYMAAMIGTLVFALGAAVSQSFFAEISHNEHQLVRHIRKATVATACTMWPVAIVLYTCAPLVLSLFGHEYVQAAPALRWLLVSSVAVAGNYVAGSIIGFYKQAGLLTAVNAVNAAVVLVIALQAHSLAGVGLAWLWGEVVNLVLFGIGAALLMRKHLAI